MAWTELANLRGAQGDPGPVGPQGPQGVKGDPGAATVDDIGGATAVGKSLLKAADEAAARAAVGAVEAAGITKIQVITQAAYDALGAKDATTLYVITG